MLQREQQHKAVASNLDDEPAVQKERDTGGAARHHHLGGQKGR
jgi:hypothetical protein